MREAGAAGAEAQLVKVDIVASLYTQTIQHDTNSIVKINRMSVESPYTSLLRAAGWQGDCSTLSRLLPEWHHTIGGMSSCLEGAVDSNHHDCVKFILSNTVISDEFLVNCALMAAGVATGKYKPGSYADHTILELLLDNIKDQKSIERRLSGVLDHAMKDIRLVDVCLRKITVDLPGGHMYGAVAIGTAAVVKRCLEDPRMDPACMDNIPLIEAVKKGDAKMVKLLAADPRVDPAVRDNWAIREASVRGNAEIVTCLMQYRRVDPTARDNECLRWAVYSNHVDVVRALLTDRRIDPSVNNNCTIRWAMKEGHYDIVTQLLSDSRVDPSVADNEVMRTAVERGQYTLITFLLTDPRVDVSIVPSGPSAPASDSSDLTDLF